MSLLLNNHHVLNKAQEEIDLYSSKDSKVEEPDVRNLVYLRAVIKETMRLRPPGTILGPRESAEDCNVAGYHIPQGQV